MKAELIVALDVPSASSLPTILDLLPDEVKWLKVGMELFTAGGPPVVESLVRRGKSVFLDLKFHDIPNTVARAVASAAGLGVSMLTLHAAGGRAMISAAAESARSFGATAPKLIAVTTLTSLDSSDLADIGITRSLSDQALALAEMALTSGADGIVSSVHEAAAFRRKFGADPLLVTPGIRPASESVSDDQKRVATPSSAVAAGSSFLVVGRPILQAQDPRAAALAILEEMRFGI